MRKRIIRPEGPGAAEWLDLEQIAHAEVTSEDPAHPVEGALVAGDGWRAAAPGEQTLRLLFDEPQSLRRIFLRFVEPDLERTQEFVLRWSPDGKAFHEILRQQWNFSPQGATEESEDREVDLPQVAALELTIRPGRSDARASLAEMKLA